MLESPGSFGPSHGRRNLRLSLSAEADVHCGQLAQPRTTHRHPVRFLSQHPHRTVFGPGQGGTRTTCHWGQRKLLLAELDFLLDYGHLLDASEPAHIVYAGAAMGSHLGFLAGLLPGVTFHLFDMTPFDQRLLAFKNVRIHHEYFTVETAREFARLKNAFFISDIRRETDDASVDADNRLQLECHRIMRPVQSLFKFRLPFGCDQYRYVAGRIFLPVWGPRNTTETRLVPEPGADRVYTADYRNRMAYFNAYTRPTVYLSTKLVKGYCRCYDCSREILAFSRLIRAFGLRKTVEDISAAASMAILGEPTPVVQYCNLNDRPRGRF